MTKVGSNQPYLFPYIGFWQLMNFVDIYVISDSMQYIKKGYINRNNILVENKKFLFSLEVLGVHEKSLINEVEVGNNRKKLLKTIFHAYKKAPYFNERYPLIEEILLYSEKNLAKYVGNSMQQIADFLEMSTEFIYLSDLQGETSLTKQARTMDICKRVHASQYINAIGGEALYNKKDFLNKGINLNFLKTNSDIHYKQFNNEFIANLSIIDIMMFNSKSDMKKLLNQFTLI